LTLKSISFIDPAQAQQYLQNILKIQSQDTEASVSPSCSTSDSCSTSFRNDNDISDKCNIWCSKRPNATDLEATLLFLNLRDKYATDFDDKKHIKSQLWKKIAKEMADSGFNVGEGEEAVEKLRQKFANLQKQYLKHIQHVKQTGEEKREPPPFFNEIVRYGARKESETPYFLEGCVARALATAVPPPPDSVLPGRPSI
jgi:hypothetical protein